MLETQGYTEQNRRHSWPLGMPIKLLPRVIGIECRSIKWFRFLGFAGKPVDVYVDVDVDETRRGAKRWPRLSSAPQTKTRSGHCYWWMGVWSLDSSSGG